MCLIHIHTTFICGCPSRTVIIATRMHIWYVCVAGWLVSPLIQTHTSRGWSSLIALFVYICIIIEQIFTWTVSYSDREVIARVFGDCCFCFSLLFFVCGFVFRCLVLIWYLGGGRRVNIYRLCVCAITQEPWEYICGWVEDRTPLITDYY